MAEKLFGIDLPGILNNAFATAAPLLSATLIRKTPGTRTAGALGGGTNPTSTSYSAKGFVEDYDDHQIDGTQVRRGDRQITLMGASIASGIVPKANDQITIESTTYTVIRVKRDPAKATYCCHARGN